MANVDLKKTYRDHYTAKRAPTIVEVSQRPYLMIDGSGDPNTSAEYTNAVKALYPIAYGLRAEIKKTTGDGYVVMPLEGLWWVDDMSKFSVDHKTDWGWTAMICVPDLVTPAMAADVLPAVTAEKELASGDKVRLEMYGDGLAAQVMHLGPYAEEAPTIKALHEFIRGEGLELTGKHHEIYLSDPRKSDPAKLRTIIRQPVRRG
ncbi:MAG: GyrI-like domain-containing protein [Actinomycetota bacterium]|nr:GyrI-like domain-containing protein [Actinomycetota bacterium]